MNALNDATWLEANRVALGAELAWLRRLLGGGAQGSATRAIEVPAATAPMLDFLCEQLQLSAFERALILLCAGAELESDWARLCATARADERCDYPSFGLALAMLPEAHWSALSPQSPLRYWHLLQVSETAPLTAARLFLDERILFFLLGIGILDKRVGALARPLSAPASLSASHEQQRERLGRLLKDCAGDPPVIALRGNDRGGARAVAAQSCIALGLSSFTLRADDIPSSLDERALLARLLTREWLLGRAVMIVETAGDSAPLLGAFLDQLNGPVIVLGEAPAAMLRQCAALEIGKPMAEEQRLLWRGAMADAEVNDDELARLASHFDFPAADIMAAADEARRDAAPGATTYPQALWQACQRRTGSHLALLAQRVAPRAAWDDLVLPPGQLALLHDIARQVRHRAMVYQQWGFAARSARGLGIGALFAGESGTGKTLAAEVIAADLGLELYRIDLAAVVSKYIGETEKNLERLFSAAEASGAVLLFDEADALFGKRSEVKDSHDRYANIELAYLLQRMESYRGLSILTTNQKSLLDTAFLRRIRFVVQFPFPDLAQRAEIWRRIFPEPLPCDPLKIEQLARLHMAGGNIRNIALNAAFLAADDGGRVSMAHLARAARMEYAKLEKPLSEAEMGGWR
jgi:hypothetical protein